MRMSDAVLLAFSTLRKEPVRTLLTVLGLAVGIGAILTVLTLGRAGQEQVEVEISKLGVDKVWVMADSASERQLDARAGEAVAAITGMSACAGAYTAGVVTLEEKTALAQITGFDASMEEVHHPALQSGRMITAGEYTSGAAVALIDEDLAEALGGNPVGERVDIGSRRVRVVGVVGGVKAQVTSRAEGMLILPLRTFLDTYSMPVDEVTVDVPRGGRAENVGDAAVAALASSGGSYRAVSFQNEIDAARSVIRIFVMVLACVAVVCMLTGGIGVMNILLVSVRERRREIGLIKAIGGTSRQVGLLFMLEAVCYTLLGGVLGLALGMGMIRLFGWWIGLGTFLRLETVLPVLLISAVLGVVFGVAPALRAAEMIPVAALKQEE